MALPPGGDRTPVRVEGRDHHYLSRVLRLDVGDDIDAVDPEGRVARARVVRLTPDRLDLEAWVVDESSLPEIPFHLHLFPCLPKGRKMDIIVRQATEAGVTAITPVFSERAIGDPSSHQVERWSRIAVEALQQSGRRVAPLIHPPTDFGRLDAARSAENVVSSDVFFHEDGASARPLHRILAGARGLVRVLVGPEGGLSPAETRLLRDAGWSQAWLGPTVLRSETAAIAAVIAVTIVLLESDTWTPRTTEGSESSMSPSTR